MSNAIPPILVQIAADVSQLKAGLAQAETSIKGMNNSVETANTGMQSMIASAKRMAGAVGIAFAGQQVLQFGKDVVLAASSMNESISKVNVVFGQGANAVLKFGESAATSMGLSNQQAIEAAGTYGNLFQAFGLGQTESQKMSTSLVQLAADLASFNNTSVDDALNALRSGLSGETEPLKRFGVALNETTLKNKAFAMGFGQIKGAMDPAMKAQVTYALVMEQTTLAQGDYARTASGTANTMKTLSAQFADTKVAIGDLVLPAFNALLKVTGVIIPLIKSLAKYFKDNADALKIFAIILATATVGFYAYKAALVITSTATAVYTAVTKSMAAGNSLAAIATLNLKGAFMMLNMAMKANPVGFIVTGLIALGAAFVWAWKKSETFRGIVIAGVQVILNGFAALVGGIGTFVGMLSKVPGMGWAKGIADGAKNASESIKTTAKNLGDLKKANAGYGEGAFVYPSGGTTSGTGAGGKGGGGSSSAAAAAAKEAKDKADKIKKAMSEVSDVYDKMNKEILDAQDKVAEATKNRDEDTAKAHKRYNETIAEADKRFMESSAEANEKYNERKADIEKRYAETKASLHKRSNEVIESATKTYNEKVADLYKKNGETIASAAKVHNERVADLQDRFEEQTTKAQETYAERKLEIEKNYLEKTQDFNKKHAETIEKINTTYNEKLAELQKRFNEESVKAQKNYNDKRENIEDTYADKVLSLKKNYFEQTSKLEIDAAKKSDDLTKAASDKQLSIVQQSMDRLRNAFASKTGANLSEAMGEDKSAGSLLANLKTKLTAAKDLAQNAALLQGQGFSQTFIEQVVGAGTEVGNSLAGSILNASPEAIAELQSTFVELEKTSNYGLDSLAATMNSGGKLATDELMKAYRGVSTDLATSLIEVQSSLNEKLAEANTKYQEAMTEAATVRAEGLAAAKTALDEALLASKTSFDEGVVAATKTMNDGIAEANKALAEGLAEAEKTRTEALAEADKTLKAALAAAKKTLDDGLVEAAKALNDKITEANKDLAEGLAEAAKDLAEKIAEAKKTLDEGLAEATKDLTEALADAKKDLDKALAEADKTYKETLAAAQKDLTEQLAAVQKTYTEALDKIAKDTDASIAALKTKLAELAATLTELGAKQAAIAALANAPVYTPVTTTADTSNAGSVNTTTLAGIAAASGSLTINQTINNTSVSANAVADATLAAIKFGTSGGYSFTGSMGSK